MDEGASYEDGRCIIAAADDFLSRVSASEVPCEDLSGFVGILAQLCARAQAVLVSVTDEAERRGVVEISQAKNTRAWVADSGWHVKNAAWAIAKAARISRRPEVAQVWERIRMTDIGVPVANSVVNAYDKLTPLLDDDEVRESVLNQLLDAGAEHGTRKVDALRKELLARYSPGEFEKENERAARQIFLSPGEQCGDGWEYRLGLDAEGRAVLEAAIARLGAEARTRR